MTGSRENEASEKECAFLEGVLRRCPAHLPVLEALGDLYTKHGRIEEGLEIDLKLTSMSPDNETYQYNLACSLSLLGRNDEALACIQKAITCGYSDWEWMQKDSDLKSLRKLPAFIALLAALKQQRGAG